MKLVLVACIVGLASAVEVEDFKESEIWQSALARLKEHPVVVLDYSNICTRSDRCCSKVHCERTCSGGNECKKRECGGGIDALNGYKCETAWWVYLLLALFFAICFFIVTFPIWVDCCCPPRRKKASDKSNRSTSVPTPESSDVEV